MNLSKLEANIPPWAKWLALALLLLAIFGPPFTASSERKKCRQTCTTQGFAGFRYKPYYREKTGPKPATCHCLSEEEKHMKNQIPAGTRVF